jgi:hypothetical protein
MATAEDLIGTWRMTSWTRESVATGERRDCLGPAPIGYIAYHADGHMMATVFRRDRPRPDGQFNDADKAALFDSMLAYVARYTLQDGCVTHHVEAAWNPAWAVDLARPFALEGRRLTIEAPGPDPDTGEAIVQRMAFEKV